MRKNKQSIGILSLGCPRNLTDSESILGRLNFKGYPIVQIDQADVAIVNTCAFLEDAKRESIDAILDLIELKKEGRLKKLIVYGCLAQRYKDKLLKDLPEIDAFVGRVSLNHSLQRFPITASHYTYLKICEGCINNCSFCVIPKIKGKFTSVDMISLLKRVDAFDKEKVSEINIIGQDITAFGIDLYGTCKLDELLRRIIKRIKHIGWIRLLYLYPDRLTNELLGLIRDEPKICKYIDLPIQHINDRILRLMNRKTKKREILRLIKRLRRIIPEVALRTSIIVGFPSETDKEFKELLEFIEEAKFERLGVFEYSREEGTKAYKLKKQIPQKIKTERLNMLMSAQQEVSRGINKKLQGRVVDVLIDEKQEGHFLGRTQYDAPEVDGLVFINPVRSKTPEASVPPTAGTSNGVKSDTQLNVGDFVKVKVTDTLEYDLVGELQE